jgi:hypothetical protein
LALRPSRPQTRAEQLAQRNAAQQEVLLREVDDAVREDDLNGAIQRYWKPVTAGITLGLLGFAGYLLWNSHAQSNRERRAEQYVQALDRVESGAMADASAQLAPLAESGSGGSQASATILRAGLAVRQGKVDDAVHMLAAVAADTGAPQPLRDLAQIRRTALEYDKLSPDEVIARLKPLALPGAPWFGSAGELVGMAYLKQGHKDLAAPLFGAMAKDKSVPDSLRARARQMAGLLGFDAVDDTVTTSAADGSAAASTAAP